jgi:hypothetical protein
MVRPYPFLKILSFVYRRCKSSRLVDPFSTQTDFDNIGHDPKPVRIVSPAAISPQRSRP